MQRLRSHGITRDPEKMLPRPAEEIWNYQQISLGFNYRMTDIQAALGTSQLARLDEFVEARHRIVCRYNKGLDGLPLQTPWQSPDSYSSYHLYPIRVKLREARKSQRQVYKALEAAGIHANLHYSPVYRQPYYEAMGFKAGYCPAAEQYHTEAISIPMYPAMRDDQQAHVVAVLRKLFDL